MLDDATRERIQNEINGSDVFLFMKGTPVFPQCGFSAAVVQVLTHMGIKFKSLNVLEDPAVRDGIKTTTRLIQVTSPALCEGANSSAAATSSARCTRPANSPTI